MQYKKFISCIVVYCHFLNSSGEEPPLLKAGKIKEAQRKAFVPDLGGIRSYSGYFTVNKECGNNLFFWFIRAQKNWESAPVLLWLNGGPGTPSLLGMFYEIGPFRFDKKKGLVDNKYHWTDKNNVLFLDQPVGTGFSFTTKNCLANNMTVSTHEAYEALAQFFELFPNLKNNAFFITGESFAGHYIPALAVEIDKRNSNKREIALVGIMVGNGLIDLRCNHIGEYAYQLGIVDEKTRDTIEFHVNNATKYINKKDYQSAAEAHGKLWSSVSNSGIPSIYNVLSDIVIDTESYESFLELNETRKKIHVGSTDFLPSNTDVYYKFENEIYIPSNTYYEHLLKTNKYTVGLYSGDLDMFCMNSAVPCVLRQLEWSGAADYRGANRSRWYVGGRLAGWYKTAGNLFEVVVRDCGHFVPTDQPAAALDLLTAFTADRPGSRLLTRLNTTGQL